jgi:hypothetical protein
MQTTCKTELSFPHSAAAAAAQVLELMQEGATGVPQNSCASLALSDAAAIQCRSAQPGPKPEVVPPVVDADAASHHHHQQQHQQMQQQQSGLRRPPATFRECMQPVLGWMEDIAITSRYIMHCISALVVLFEMLVQQLVAHQRSI